MIPVKWTQAHLDDLENNFPELLDEHEPNKLILNSGKRVVVSYVRNRLRIQQSKLHGKG
jgi:hypothetical protein